jgi:hypothetical protein
MRCAVPLTQAIAAFGGRVLRVVHRPQADVGVEVLNVAVRARGAYGVPLHNAAE